MGTCCVQHFIFTAGDIENDHEGTPLKGLIAFFVEKLDFASKRKQSNRF